MPHLARRALRALPIPLLTFLLGLFAAADRAVGDDVEAPADAAPLVSLDDAALLERLWRERGRDASAFAPSFLEAVPEADVREAFEGAVRSYGEVESVRGASAPSPAGC